MNTVARIVTKFSIGERLWPVYQLARVYRVHPAFDCRFITVTEHEIQYGFSRNYGVPEFNVFPSKKEAQAEADRRNALAVSTKRGNSHQ